MQSIKSYTNISQSEKLSEILPIESADCYWEDDTVVEFGHGWHPQHIPCWSLTALMNFIESLGKVEINFNCNSNKYWVNVHFESIGSFCQDHELYDSKIDALIAIIEKLKSRNLL